MRPNGIEVLLARLDKRPDGCWVYTGWCTPRMGYGELSYQGRAWRAHRLAYTLLVGPIPDGLEVLHTCDNPPCCNPAHLYAGTQQQNIADKVARNRCARGERSGHVTHPERMPRGERVGTSRLTAAQVESIRSRHAGGEEQAALAREFGVSKSQVGNIVHGRHWAHAEV